MSQQNAAEGLFACARWGGDDDDDDDASERIQVSACCTLCDEPGLGAREGVLPHLVLGNV